MTMKVISVMKSSFNSKNMPKRNSWYNIGRIESGMLLG